MKQNDEKQSAAIHEAGHFFAHWIEGSRISKVEIFADGSGETLANPQIMKCLSKVSWDSREMRSWAKVCLAGISSEMYQNFSISGSVPVYLADDILIIWSSMESRGWSPPLYYGNSIFFHKFAGEVKIMTISYWPQIQKFADFLLEKRQISGYEAVEFIEGIWQGPLPVKALRYEHKKQ